QPGRPIVRWRHPPAPPPPPAARAQFGVITLSARPCRFVLDLAQGLRALLRGDYDLDNCPGTPLKIAWQRSKEGSLVPRKTNPMNYETYFTGALARLRDERRYRVFADLERRAGGFPRAIWLSPEGRRGGVARCGSGHPGIGR